MFLRLETCPEKTLVGKHVTVSLNNNRTAELWRSFMPLKDSIPFSVNSYLYSLEVYDNQYFTNFSPEHTFEKWAAIEVTNMATVAPGLATLQIPEGCYAVFLHSGPASLGFKTYRFIFETWLPNSGYSLDSRPHFAIMGSKYQHEHPASEEEIWIPIK
jgi:AraC family transcriptional regulator